MAIEEKRSQREVEAQESEKRRRGSRARVEIANATGSLRDG